MTKYTCECDRIENENKKLKMAIRKLRDKWKKKCEDCQYDRTLECKECGEYQ